MIGHNIDMVCSTLAEFLKGKNTDTIPCELLCSGSEDSSVLVASLEHILVHPLHPGHLQDARAVSKIQSEGRTCECCQSPCARKSIQWVGISPPRASLGANHARYRGR